MSPFPSVLLSLSGEDGYRNNSVTGVGGTFMFDNLFPGSFYLRPLLKEYAFSPPAEAIDIGSGESKEVVFYATRVAFSAMGKVTLLSGQPKEGVSVEARAESKGFYEETITDSSGCYRLRGLQADTTYVIKIARKGKLHGMHIERASPESLNVKVGFEDIKELDFVVIELPDVTILSGHVEGKNLKEIRSHIRVEIRSVDDPSKVESVFPLPISNFFQVKDLPKGKHLLQLRSAMTYSTRRFESDVIEVDLERQPHIHVGPLSYRIDEDIYKQVNQAQEFSVGSSVNGPSKPKQQQFELDHLDKDDGFFSTKAQEQGESNSLAQHNPKDSLHTKQDGLPLKAHDKEEVAPKSNAQHVRKAGIKSGESSVVKVEEAN